MECEIRQIAENTSELVCASVLKMVRDSYDNKTTVSILTKAAVDCTERSEDCILDDIRATKDLIGKQQLILERYEKELTDHDR